MLYLTAADTRRDAANHARVVWGEPTSFGGKFLVFGPGPSLTLITAEDLLRGEGIDSENVGATKLWDIVEKLRKDGREIQYAPSEESFVRRAIDGYEKIKRVAKEIADGATG